MTYNFDLNYIRYKGLPIGMEIVTKDNTNEIGLIVFKDKTYKEKCKNLFKRGKEIDEWYIKNIIKKQKWSYYNEALDLYKIEDKEYVFFGYSYSCEYINTENNKRKRLVKVSWKNIKFIIKRGGD